MLKSSTLVSVFYCLVPQSLSFICVFSVIFMFSPLPIYQMKNLKQGSLTFKHHEELRSECGQLDCRASLLTSVLRWFPKAPTGACMQLTWKAQVGQGICKIKDIWKGFSNAFPFSDFIFLTAMGKIWVWFAHGLGIYPKMSFIGSLVLSVTIFWGGRTFKRGSLVHGDWVTGRHHPWKELIWLSWNFASQVSTIINKTAPFQFLWSHVTM